MELGKTSPIHKEVGKSEQKRIATKADATPGPSSALDFREKTSVLVSPDSPNCLYNLQGKSLMTLPSGPTDTAPTAAP